jgi:GNAT superfamily N-acetyltransferase
MTPGPPFGPPQKLSSEHTISDFECGEPALDEWFRRRALQNQESGASRTYVICAGRRIVGYYALAVGSVAHTGATGKVKRNMPDPVPVMVLGRLAVHKDCQGKGIGVALLRDAILRTMQAADIAGIRAILVHAISEGARTFYGRCGFHSTPLDPMTLMITLDEARRALV